jgi:hypothetical protein
MSWLDEFLQKPITFQWFLIYVVCKAVLQFLIDFTIGYFGWHKDPMWNRKNYEKHI